MLGSALRKPTRCGLYEDPIWTRSSLGIEIAGSVRCDVSRGRRTVCELYSRSWQPLLTAVCGPARHEHRSAQAPQPCESPGKRPLGSGWNARAIERFQQACSERLTRHLDDLEKHVESGGNVGLVIPPGVVALDADSAEAVQWCDQAIPQAPKQRTAKGAHFVVRVPPDREIKATTGVELAPGVLVDVRSGDRSQIVCEPSIHATGTPYTWERPLPETLDGLPSCPPLILDAITQSKQRTSGTDRVIPEGQRNQRLFEIASAMRGRGESREDIAEELRRTNERRCRPPLGSAEIASIAASAARNYPAGAGDEQTRATEFEPFVPLDESVREDFPVHVLPEVLRASAESLAEATQTPVDLTAGLSLGAVAIARAKRTSVEPRAGWVEPLVIWPTPISKSGTRKSTVFRSAIQPIQEFELEQAKLLAPTIARDREHVAALEECVRTTRRAFVKKRTKGADHHAAQSDLEAATLELEDARAKATCAPRYIADDVTPEALAVLLHQNGERIALCSAEGGEVVEMMFGRYAKNARPNIGIYLSGHAGDSVSVDRKHGDAIRLEAPALNIVMAIQPSVLDELRDARVLRGRGLLARFWWIYPEPTLGHRRVNADPVPDAVRGRYASVIRALLQDPAERVLRFEPDALHVLDAFAEELEPRLGEDGDLAELTDWAGKLAGLCVRFAGVLHEADYAGTAVPESIPAETVERALTLGRYALSHAIYCFRQMEQEIDVRAALRIWRNVAQRGETTLRERDLYQQVKGGVMGTRKADRFDPAIELLREHGYLRHSPKDSRLLEVNPQAVAHARDTNGWG